MYTSRNRVQTETTHLEDIASWDGEPFAHALKFPSYFKLLPDLTSKPSKFQFCWWPHQVRRNNSAHQEKLAPDLPLNGFSSSLNDVSEIQNDLAESPLSLIGSLTVKSIETSGSDEQTDDSDVMVGVVAVDEEIHETFEDSDGKLDVLNPEVVAPNRIWLAQSMF